MIISPLIEAEAELTHNAKLNCPVVLSTRIRLARNISDIPFPAWAKEAQRREILATCMEWLTALPQMDGGTCLMVEELSELEKQILMGKIQFYFSLYCINEIYKSCEHDVFIY